MRAELPAIQAGSRIRPDDDHHAMIKTMVRPTEQVRVSFTASFAGAARSA